MKKLIAIVLAFSLFAVACGDDEATADLSTCEGIADGTVTLIQDLIDTLAELDQETLGIVFAGGELPEEMAALETLGDDLATAAQDLGCTNLRDLISERADVIDVAPEDGLGQLIKDGAVSGDEDVLGRLFR